MRRLANGRLPNGVRANRDNDDLHHQSYHHPLLLTTGSPTGSGPRSAVVPPSDSLQALVDETYAKFKDDKSGTNADYIPYLASVPSELFGIAIVTVNGKVYTAGDTGYAFSIQSCSKVFTLAEIIEESGEDAVLKKIGVEPTGMAFNSITAIGLHDNTALNPLVNAGAMASVSLVQAMNADERWNKILAFESSFAGEPLKLIDEVYRSGSRLEFPQSRHRVHSLQRPAPFL